MQIRLCSPFHRGKPSTSKGSPASKIPIQTPGQAAPSSLPLHCCLPHPFPSSVAFPCLLELCTAEPHLDTLSLKTRTTLSPVSPVKYQLLIEVPDLNGHSGPPPRLPWALQYFTVLSLFLSLSNMVLSVHLSV